MILGQWMENIRHGTGQAVPRQSTVALEWTNFFLADVQAGLGPFVAAYLAGLGWNAGAVGQALTLGGIVTVASQTPAGWLVDRIPAKRLILMVSASVLAGGALLLSLNARTTTVYIAQILVGLAASFAGPTLAAITLNIAGKERFDRQFGRNQSFNAAGNLFAAATMAAISRFAGQQYIFYAAALLTLPTIAATGFIKKEDTHVNPSPNKRLDGFQPKAKRAAGFANVTQYSPLFVFIACAFLFHLANAAMLPQLGELLARDARRTAAPFMSACVAITQVVVLLTASFFARYATNHGRKGLLLLAFAILPLRAALYTLLTSTLGLLAVQLLDGMANSIFGVVSILVIADLTAPWGRFNLAQGLLGTGAGLGAALSNVFGGTLMQAYGYRASFLALGGTACLGFLLLLAGVGETAPKKAGTWQSR